MSFDLSSGSTEFHKEATWVPILPPDEPDFIETNNNLKVARIALPHPSGSEIQRSGRRETPLAGRIDDSLAGKVKWFAYRAARRLFELKVADFLALDLGRMSETLPEKSKFEFRFLSPGEIRVLAVDPANDLDVSIAERLEQGRNFCVGAFDGLRLVNYSWYALGHVEPEHSFGSGFSLPSDAVYMHKAFTLPEYRGQRVHQATIHRAVRTFAKMGIRQLIAIVEFGNWISLRSHQRMGCRRIGRIWMLGHKLVAQQGDIGVKALRSFS